MSRFKQSLVNQNSKLNDSFERIIIYYGYLRSAIAILAKAEALAAKFNAAIDDDECDYFWSEEFGLEESRPNDSYGSVKIGNKDWKLKIVDGEKD